MQFSMRPAAFSPRVCETVTARSSKAAGHVLDRRCNYPFAANNLVWSKSYGCEQEA